MELQELFDKSVTHLRKQGVKSVNKSLADESGAFCSYRGDNGLMCAIGCVIPDKEYELGFEGKLASYVAKRGVSTLQGLTARAMNHLQAIHDNDPTERWEGKWKNFAMLHNLKFTPLKG
jgi:hypothetical protein